MVSFTNIWISAIVFVTLILNILIWYGKFCRFTTFFVNNTAHFGFVCLFVFVGFFLTSLLEYNCFTMVC